MLVTHSLHLPVRPFPSRRHRVDEPSALKREIRKFYF